MFDRLRAGNHTDLETPDLAVSLRTLDSAPYLKRLD